MLNRPKFAHNTTRTLLAREQGFREVAIYKVPAEGHVAEPLLISTFQGMALVGLVFRAERELVLMTRDGQLTCWRISEPTEANEDVVCEILWTHDFRTEFIDCDVRRRERVEILCGDSRGLVFHVDVTKLPRWALGHGHMDAIVTVRFDSTRERFVSTGRDRKVCVWNIAPIIEEEALTAESVLEHLETPLDGEAPLPREDVSDLPREDVSDAQKRVAPPLLKPQMTLSGLGGWALAACFSHDGTRLIAGGIDNGIYLWSLEDKGRLIASQFAHYAWVVDVEFSPDDSTIVSASWDTTIGIFDGHTLEPRMCLEVHTDYVSDLEFVGADTLISSGYDQRIGIWDWRVPRLIRLVRAHGDWVEALGPWGEGVFSVSSDGTMRAWTADGESVWSLGVDKSAGIELGAAVTFDEYVDRQDKNLSVSAPEVEAVAPVRYRDQRASGFSGNRQASALSLLESAIETSELGVGEPQKFAEPESLLTPEIPHVEDPIPSASVTSFGLPFDTPKATEIQEATAIRTPVDEPESLAMPEQPVIANTSIPSANVTSFGLPVSSREAAQIPDEVAIPAHTFEEFEAAETEIGEEISWPPKTEAPFREPTRPRVDLSKLRGSLEKQAETVAYEESKEDGKFDRPDVGEKLNAPDFNLDSPGTSETESGLDSLASEQRPAFFTFNNQPAQMVSDHTPLGFRLLPEPEPSEHNEPSPQIPRKTTLIQTVPQAEVNTPAIPLKVGAENTKPSTKASEEPVLAVALGIFDVNANELLVDKPKPTAAGIIRRHKRTEILKYVEHFRIRTPHQWVHAVAYNPQLGWFASCGGDNTVCVWSLHGELLHKFRVEATGLNALCFSPDGTLLAAGGDEGVVHLWLLPRGDSSVRHAMLRGHSAWVTGLTFSSNAQVLFSSSYDGTVRIWNLEQGVCEMILLGHEDPVSCVSAHLGRLTSAGHDGTLRLWNKQGIQVDLFDGFEKLLSCTTNGVTNAWCGANGEVFISEEGRPRPLLRHHGEARAVTILDDGTLFSIGQDGFVMIYPKGSYEPQQSLRIGSPLWSVEAHGKFLLLGADDGLVHIYCLQTQ